MNFPDEGLREHHEGKAGVGKKSTGPSIVRAVEAGTDLVKIVRSTHTPFHVIVSEDVVTVGKLSWVTVGLVGRGTFTAVNVRSRVEVDVVLALAGSLTKVVEARSNVLSKTAGG